MSPEPSSATSVRPTPASSVDAWDEAADIIVVGLGAAGTCAAIEARQAGAEVLAIERAGAGGGASALSGGVLYLGGGTSLQTACGFEDTPEAMYRYLVAGLGPGADEARIRVYADGSVEHFDWLVERGVPFKPTFWSEPAWAPPTDAGLMWLGEAAHPFPDIARPAPRGHATTGSDFSGGVLMGTLVDHAVELGVRVEADSAVERLVVDGDRVVGVEVRRFGQVSALRARRAVILTAGGFVYNEELLALQAPELVGQLKLGTDHDDGRGIRMGQAAGAAVRRMDAAGVSINLSPAVMARSILVNRSGQRFINEDAYGGRIAQQTLFHQGGRAWAIFDERSYDEIPAELRYGRRAEHVCETADELEAELGLPTGALVSTIERYNVDAEHGVDLAFHKRREYFRALEPPFGAIDSWSRRAGSGFQVFTLGGLLTDVEGRVLDIDGAPIPGLFAAGRTASGMHGSGYISGTSLGDATFFGRRAGRCAAGPAGAAP